MMVLHVCFREGLILNKHRLTPTFSRCLTLSFTSILCLFVSVMASSGWLGQDIYSEEEEGSHSSDEEDDSSSSSKEHLSEADRQVIVHL